MNKLKVNESSETTKQLWSLANGPKPHVGVHSLYGQWCKVPYKGPRQSSCNPKQWCMYQRGL